MSASVQTDVTADAIREALGEVSAMRGDRPVTVDELETARAALTRGYPRNFETADQVARSVAQLALYELPDDYFATFVPRVEALGLDAIHDAAVRHLHPDRLVTLVVGDKARVESTLGGLAPGAPIAREAQPLLRRRGSLLAPPELAGGSSALNPRSTGPEVLRPGGSDPTLVPAAVGASARAVNHLGPLATARARA
jgi:hypothetical protein